MPEYEYAIASVAQLWNFWGSLFTYYVPDDVTEEKFKDGTFGLSACLRAWAADGWKLHSMERSGGGEDKERGTHWMEVLLVFEREKR